MQFTTRDIAEVTGGRHHGPSVAVVRATIDSRTAGPGDLFVAVHGERDGHDYIAAALAAGAGAYLTERAPDRPTAVQVPDTLAALQQIGQASRTRMPNRVVGVTGSVGKTTVKDLLTGALEGMGVVASSPASFNNELGVPLTLINAPDDLDVVVVELGARGRGHIRALCRIAQPTAGVVTEIAGAHLEQFKTVDEVTRAKQELVEALPRHGVAVLNAENPRVAGMADATEAQVVTFGLGTGADVSATDVRLDDDLRPRFRLLSPWGETDVGLAVHGSHQVSNALAAASVGLWHGLKTDRVAAGLATVSAPPGRMEIARLPSGAMLIDDSYNANPASVRAAFAAMSELDVERRIAVLGLMAEMGDETAGAHAGIAQAAADMGIELVAVGTDLYGVEPTDIEQVGPRLGHLDGTCAVLIKGSRVAGLERVRAVIR